MKPTTTSDKQQKGTYRPSRDKNPSSSYELLTEAPKAPKNLGTHGRKLWNELVPILVQGELLSTGDLPALVLLCQTHQLRVEADLELQKSGFIVKGSKDQPAPNPLVGVRKSLTDQETTLLRQFGLTPSSRIGVPQKTKDNNDSPYKVRE